MFENFGLVLLPREFFLRSVIVHELFELFALFVAEDHSYLLKVHNSYYKISLLNKSLLIIRIKVL